MSITFDDSQVINKSEWFVGKFPGPEGNLSPEQEAKLNQLKTLISEVGELTFDQEIDILIASMTEIRDR